MERPVQVAGANIPAGALAVFSWPFVTLSDEQVRQALDAIVGTGGTGGGPAVLAGLTSVAGMTMTTTTSQTTQVTTQELQARAASMTPSFLMAGFIRDSEVNQSVTRGYIWLAASWSSAMTQLQAGRILGAVVAAAVPAGSMYPRLPLPGAGKVSAVKSVAVLAENDSDVAVEDAAKKSVLALAQAVTAIGTVFANALSGGRKVSLDAARARTDLRTTYQLMTDAAACLQAAPAMAGGVEGLVKAALSAPQEGAATAAATLLEMKKRLTRCRTKLVEAGTAAPRVLEMCAREQDPSTSGIAKSIRDQIVSAARSYIDKRDKPTVVREFATCSLWNAAQAQLDRELRGLNEEISITCQLATLLTENATSVAALVAAIDAAIVVLDFGLSQLQLSWWTRDLWGAPVYVWLGGAGLIALVGAGFGIRAIKRRKAAAAAATVKKNRRRAR
jgi:hypothetical protein